MDAELFNKEEYKYKMSKDEYIRFLEAQAIILREDNKRLIKELERKEGKIK